MYRFFACKEYECENNDFRCDNSICVRSNKTCDGVLDCTDGSDERYCYQTGELTSNFGNFKDFFLASTARLGIGVFVFVFLELFLFL